MKKRLFVLLLFIVLFTGCKNKENVSIKSSDQFKIGVNKVDNILNEMSLDEKIAQMMIVYYTSDEMDDTLKSTLEEVKPGGFILFGENITTYEKTINFIKEIKRTSSIPMFMSIDQEGGDVQRLLYLKDMDVSNIPDMNKLGKIDDLNYTYKIGKVISEELKVFGINMDFAPVIDVYSNIDNKVIGNRSFGSNSDLVSRHGIKISEAFMDNGIVPVYKHFPGHGNTSVDSHVDLPIVNKTKEELYSEDLIPFINAIKNDAKVIMVGHLAVPSISSNNEPASLSKKIITDFLKNELNYNGLVITDALNMGALTNFYDDEEICGKAVEAGVDILLMPSSSRMCLKSIKKLISDGIIEEETINKSVRKILELKYDKIEKDYNKYLPKEYLNSEEHKKIINRE